MSTKAKVAAVKKFTPPRNTKKATYFYIRSTPSAFEVALEKAFKASTLRSRRSKGTAVDSSESEGAPPAENSSQPLGTYIYDPTNPQASINTVDTSVITRPPASNPTEGGGVVTAATAAQLIADSGPLAAGVYYVEIIMGASGVGAAGKHLQAEHRNAANSATNIVRGICPYGGAVSYVKERVVVALNERIRVVQSGVAGAASEVAQATVRVYKLAA